jgi:hypothetical protein
MALTVANRASLRLKSVAAFGRFCLRQIRPKAFRFIAFFGKCLEIRSLRARHRVVAGDPVVRLLLNYAQGRF